MQWIANDLYILLLFCHKLFASLELTHNHTSKRTPLHKYSNCQLYYIHQPAR